MFQSKSFNPHTHAGCDRLVIEVLPRQEGFNPHTHAGCDYTLLILLTFSFVSIHTPTQGVTEPNNKKDLRYIVSIHTPTQGVTSVISTGFISCRFQSTHPRRVWPRWSIRRRSIVCFNPHTHAGCDISATFSLLLIDVSIHTPTQGVTAVFGVQWWWARVSIHTPTQGVTGSCRSIRYVPIVSIHTPTQGVTKHSSKRIRKRKFQSTHPRRVWLR